MRTLLNNYYKRGQLIEMYLSKNGEISKRTVQILSIQGDKFNGYCCTKKAKRTFLIDNVFACVPVVYRERDVI